MFDYFFESVVLLVFPVHWLYQYIISEFANKILQIAHLFVEESCKTIYHYHMYLDTSAMISKIKCSAHWASEIFLKLLITFVLIR